MKPAVLGILLLAARSALAGDGHSAPAGSPPYPRGEICEQCGADLDYIRAEIAQLQASPDWRARYWSAYRLRQFDWKHHRTAVLALAGAVVHDPEARVRRRAAESLAELHPCDHHARAALCGAADGDPNPWVRSSATRGLRTMDRMCRCLECNAWPQHAPLYVEGQSGTAHPEGTPAPDQPPSSPSEPSVPPSTESPTGRAPQATPPSEPPSPPEVGRTGRPAQRVGARPGEARR